MKLDWLSKEIIKHSWPLRGHLTMIRMGTRAIFEFRAMTGALLQLSEMKFMGIPVEGSADLPDRAIEFVNRIEVPKEE